MIEAEAKAPDTLAAYHAQFAEKDFTGVIAGLQARLDARPGDAPDDLPALRLLAEAAIAVLDWPLAETTAGRILRLTKPVSSDLWILAVARRGQQDFAGAAEAFQAVLDANPTPRERHRAQQALSNALRALNRLDEAEAVVRDGLNGDHAHKAVFQMLLAEILFKQGRADDAAAAARTALEQDPSQVRARTLLATIRHEPVEGAARQRWTPWPSRTSAFDDPRGLIQKTLLRGYPQGDPFIRTDTRFMTMGSCFAGNLAKHLQKLGLDAFNEFIGEDVNSTYANRYFLQWVEQGVVNATTQVMADAYGPEMRERYREAARRCEVFVFTLGVAPCFFDLQTDAFFFMNTTGDTHRSLMSNYRMRTTTVRENVDNTREVLATLRRLCGADPQVILTVSPVPLAATAEMESAVIADCLSKSTLRLACEEVRAGDDSGRVHYWPSFEIVRWLGAYYNQGRPVFGAEDGKTRHVSPWIIDLIMELFVETYSADPALAAPA